MRLAHVMTRNAPTVAGSSPVTDVARLMREQQVDSVIVLDDAGSLAGVLSERDLAHKVVAEGRSPAEVRASECMTAHSVTADSRDRVWEGARLMAEHKVDFLPVTEEGKVVGVVSSNAISGVTAEPRATREIIRGIEESSREQTLEISSASSDLSEIIPAWY